MEGIQRAGWSINPSQSHHPIATEALRAWQRIHPDIVPTPLTPISLPPTVHIKREDLQHTGSFKARGATNVLLAMRDEQLAQGVVTSSTGNHALGCVHAFALRAQHVAGSRLDIFVPTTTAAVKLERLRTLGANVILHGQDCVEAEAAARAAAHARSIPYISPYNDPLVAGGQGTIALELLAAIPPGRLGTVFVPVGGGGLIAGIAAVLKTVVEGDDVRVVGCQPAASDVMRRSVACGQVVEEAPDAPQTLSDGTAGGVEQDSCTLQPCIEFVDTWETASEAEIAEAVIDLHTNNGIFAEGAAAMTWACARKHLAANPATAQGGVVVVCCGGNAAPTLLQSARALLDE